VKEEVWKSFIVLLTNAPELHAYAARALFRALRQHLETAQTSLLATATWYSGAYTLSLLLQDDRFDIDRHAPHCVRMYLRWGTTSQVHYGQSPPLHSPTSLVQQTA
jgi:hypothetical protein